MKMSPEPGFTWIPPAEMERRIDTIPLPKKLKVSFTRTIVRWQNHSGNEWTVARLKSFKDCLLNSYAEGGKRVSHKPEWFATTPSGRLAGVFGDLWVIAMSGAASLKAVLFIVNIYTGCSRTEATSDQKMDIAYSINRQRVKLPKRSHDDTNPGRTSAIKAMSSLGWHKSLRFQEKPVPITWQLPGKEDHVRRLADDFPALAGLPLMPGNAVHLIRCAAGSAWPIGCDPSMSQDTAGHIHMTMEPGLKIRYFASPNLVLQQALEPLKNNLLRFLAKVPWDCTLQQRRADNRIRSALASKEVVHSVDLSSATDAFPWEWQHAVLSSLLQGTQARAGLALMSNIVRYCNWELELDSSSMVKPYFTVGQPLGLGPSFPAFTLSHGVLLYFLNGNKWNEDFFVLGDDVVIFNDDLHDKYRKVLSRWKMEVSEAKSFSSCNVAQFAGVTYTADESFWIPKWRPFTRATLLDLAAWWYPGLTKGFPEHSLIERVLSLPAPYGIGRNPKGLPLSDRLTTELVDELLLREARRESQAKPTVSRLDVVRLRRLLKGKVSEGFALDLVKAAQQSYDLAHQTIQTNVRHGSTKPSLHQDLSVLAHETELGGYPRLRFRESKVDPYTLGSLHGWKRLYKRVRETQTSSVGD